MLWTYGDLTMRVTWRSTMWDEHFIGYAAKNEQPILNNL